MLRSNVALLFLFLKVIKSLQSLGLRLRLSPQGRIVSGLPYLGTGPLGHLGKPVTSGGVIKKVKREKTLVFGLPVSTKPNKQ